VQTRFGLGQTNFLVVAARTMELIGFPDEAQLGYQDAASIYIPCLVSRSDSNDANNSCFDGGICSPTCLK
jgi:hypothetical protein